MEWFQIENNTALDRALLYLPWRNETFQSVYQLARRYLYPNGNLAARILPGNRVQLLIRNDLNFNWRITAELN